MRALILSGGIYHDFPALSADLAGMLEAGCIAAQTVTDPEALVSPLIAGVDLLVVQALRWRMLGHDKYIPFRAEWAFSPSPGLRAAIADHVARGGGLLVLHTGVICFDDWPEWAQIIGGAWVWGQSNHPLPQGAQVTLAAPHSITDGAQGFALTDEVYRDLALAPDAKVLAVARADEEPGTAAHPAIWTHGFGAGRVVVDTLGHDPASLRHPTHARILRRAAVWAAGQQQEKDVA